MSWVKLDDGCMEHPKLLAAGAAGVALWLAGLCYANRQKSRDGLIPALKIACLYPMAGPQKVAAKLVEVGLWETAPDGFRIHDYHDYQPTAKQAEAVSQIRSEAGRKGGARSAAVRAAARKSTPDTDSAKQTPSKPEASCLPLAWQANEANANPVPIPISEKKISSELEDHHGPSSPPPSINALPGKSPDPAPDIRAQIRDLARRKRLPE